MVPRKTARNEAETETMAEFKKRAKNWSRTVLSAPMVSGDRPSDRQPSHCGWKSTKGMRWPCMTSGAS